MDRLIGEGAAQFGRYTQCREISAFGSSADLGRSAAVMRARGARWRRT
jgi:hypothetical protein